jgi:hypothetical protein
MIRVAESIIIRYDIISKEITREDPFGNEITESYLCIEYDVLDKDGNVLETWDWQIDSNHTTPPSLELILDRTGIKFGVSAWEIPDQGTIV